MSKQQPAPSATGPIERETIHDLLTVERRRRALSCLTAHGSLALPDLADEVARHEHDAPLPQIPEDAVLRVYLSLWQTHVPKLAEAGVVRYDQDRDVVALAERADALEQFETLDATSGCE